MKCVAISVLLVSASLLAQSDHGEPGLLPQVLDTIAWGSYWADVRLDGAEDSSADHELTVNVVLLTHEVLPSSALVVIPQINLELVLRREGARWYTDQVGYFPDNVSELPGRIIIEDDRRLRRRTQEYQLVLSISKNPIPAAIKNRTFPGRAAEQLFLAVMQELYSMRGEDCNLPTEITVPFFDISDASVFVLVENVCVIGSGIMEVKQHDGKWVVIGYPKSLSGKYHRIASKIKGAAAARRLLKAPIESLRDR